MKSLLTFFVAALCLNQVWSQTLTNGNFNNGGTGWGCNVETNAETVYGGTNGGNTVAEVDQLAGLCQTISGFTIGASYTLSFECSRRTNCGPAVQTMDVSVDGGALPATGVSRSGAFLFTTENINFTATQTTHILDFTATITGTCGLIVDDISIVLNCVPPSQSITVCDSFVSPSGNYTWYNSGIYNDTVTSDAACSDSTITIDLTVLNTPTSTNVVQACQYYVWPLNSQLYTESVIDTVVFPTEFGCDSTVILDLTVQIPVESTDSVSMCNSYVWPVTGDTYTNDINLTILQGGSLGCDSAYTLVLDIAYSDTTEEEVSSCGPYVWPLNGTTYDASGQYTYNYTNSDGCPSMGTLNLTVNPIDASVSQPAIDILEANATNATYQWVNCEDNFAPINGEINATFTVTNLNTSYAVIVTENECVDTSDCFAFYASLFENVTDNLLIYPNPSDGLINIKSDGLGLVEIRVFSPSGEKVYHAENIETELFSFRLDEPAGAYIIQITGEYTHKLVRIVLTD